MDKEQVSFELLKALVSGKGPLTDHEINEAVDTAIKLAEELHGRFK